MATKTPAQIAQNWANRMSQSTDAYKAGIQAVTEHPGDAAIAQQSRMLANLTASVNNGVWARGLKKQSLQQWQASAASKGAERLAAGATAAKPKMLAHATAIAPVLADIQSTVKSMPKGGTENALARVRVAMQKLADFKASKG